MSSELDLVIFDLDGTLVDSLPDIAAALNHALATSGLKELTTEVVRGLVGDGIVALATRALAEQSGPTNLQAEDLARLVWHHYSQHPCVHTQLYSEIPYVLAELKAAAVPVAVLTNKPGDLARLLLGELGLQDSFVAVLGDGDGFPRKPDPSALLDLMRKHNAHPERTLMVGDGVPDIQVAKAAGCVAVAALWGYSARAVLLEQQPNNALMSPSQILDLP